MKDPKKTSFNGEFFKGMSLPDFKGYWVAHSFSGDPKDYYTKLTGRPLPGQDEEE